MYVEVEIIGKGGAKRSRLAYNMASANLLIARDPAPRDQLDGYNILRMYNQFFGGPTTPGETHLRREAFGAGASVYVLVASAWTRCP